MIGINVWNKSINYNHFSLLINQTQLPSVLRSEGENQAKESEAQNFADSFFSYKFDCQSQQEPTSYSKA